MPRPTTYQSDDARPMTISVRIPRDLYDETQRYLSRRRMTMTALLLEALRLRLDTPADPRDLLLSDDNTVIQEVQAMIRAAVQAEIGTLSDFLGPRVSTPGDRPAPGASALPVPALSYDDNTVLQHKTPRGAGRRGVMRQRILALLAEHPEGLSAEELRVHLKPERPIGDVLQGMVRQQVVAHQGTGKGGRYVALTP